MLGERGLRQQFRGVGGHPGFPTKLRGFHREPSFRKIPSTDTRCRCKWGIVFVLFVQYPTGTKPKGGFLSKKHRTGLKNDIQGHVYVCYPVDFPSPQNMYAIGTISNSRYIIPCCCRATFVFGFIVNSIFRDMFISFSMKMHTRKSTRTS